MRRELTGVDDVHAAHGATGVIEDPVLLEVDVRRGALVELGDNVLNNATRVVAVLGDAALGQVVQVLRVEDVESLEVLLDEVDDRRQQCGQQAEDGQEAAHAGRRVGFRRHGGLCGGVYRKIREYSYRSVVKNGAYYLKGMRSREAPSREISKGTVGFL